jgi:hypothetical protein
MFAGPNAMKRWKAHVKKKHTPLRCAEPDCRRECAGTAGLRE